MFLLAFVALLFPVTGALVQIALALPVFFAGGVLRRSSERWPILETVFSSPFEFEARSERKVLVLYFESHRGRPPIWIAIDELGAILADDEQLPPNAFSAMRRAAR